MFAVILATCFLVVAAAVRASARDEINEEPRLAGTLFVRQLESRSQQLVPPSDLLSGDFAEDGGGDVGSRDHALRPRDEVTALQAVVSP